MVRAQKGDTVTFARCLTKEPARSGVVESVLSKGTPDEIYVVRMGERSFMVKPSDVEVAAITISRKKSKSKPKSRKK